MKKISRLETMRAARDRREAEAMAPIVVPLREWVRVQTSKIYALQGEVDTMSSIVTSQIAPQIIPDLRDLILREVRGKIMDAVCAASRTDLGAVITVPLLESEVRFLRPCEAVAKLLDEAAKTYKKDTRAVGIVDIADSVTILRVMIPSVTAEVVLADVKPQRRRA